MSATAEDLKLDSTAPPSLVGFCVMQDSRVETYLQSHEINESGIWSGIKGWTQNVGASLQQLAHQSLPGRHVSEDVDESDWVSLLLDIQLCLCLSHTIQYNTTTCSLASPMY